MGYNILTGQLKGPFIANIELFNIIKDDCAIPVKHVKHIGIQAEKSSIILINKREVEIGETEVYEIGNTEITSIIWKKDMPENTIIDYTVE